MKLASVLSLAAGLILAWGVAQADDVPALGKVIPDQTLKTIDGKSVKLSDFRNDEDGKGGSFVIVTFWSYKCPTGKRMMGKIKELSDFCNEKDVVFLGVSSYGETEKEVKEYCSDQNVDYSIAFDGNQAFARALGAKCVSTTAILDKDGKLVYYGSLVSRPSRKNPEMEPYAMAAAKQLVEGKEVSNPKTPVYG